MPTWLEAGFWGLIGGAALVLGALIAWFLRVPRDVVATVMAFGSGVLISAVAFDLMEEAAATGGLVPTSIGFIGGGPASAGAHAALPRRGARRPQRAGGGQPAEQGQAGRGAGGAPRAAARGTPRTGGPG